MSHNRDDHDQKIEDAIEQEVEILANSDGRSEEMARRAFWRVVKVVTSGAHGDEPAKPHEHGDEHDCPKMPKDRMIYFSEGQRAGRGWWMDGATQRDGVKASDGDAVCVTACPFCGERMES